VARSRLYLGCVGSYGVADGGVVAIDPVTLTAAGVVAPESALGGDVLDLAWGGDDRAFGAHLSRRRPPACARRRRDAA